MKMKLSAQLMCLVTLATSLSVVAQEKATAALDIFKSRDKQEIRVASGTGAIFVRVNSHPKFGKAFRDENGIVWSELLKDEKGAIKLYSDQASVHRDCRIAGGRVPSKKEANAMLLTLGVGTPNYSSLTASGLNVVEDFDFAPFILGDNPEFSMGFLHWEIFVPKETAKNLGQWRFRKVRIADNSETWAARCVATAE